MGRRLKRLSRKYYIRVPQLEAAVRIDYRMPTGEEIVTFQEQNSALKAGQKALEMSAHLAAQGKTVAEIEQEIAKELSPDSLLDSAEVICSFGSRCIRGVSDVDLEAFDAKGKGAPWEESEFDFPDEDGVVVWKVWRDMTHDERTIEIVQRNQMFVHFMNHIVSGFGSITVGKSRLRQLTADAKTTS